MTKIETIDEYPIPFDRDEIVAMQEESLEGNYGLRDEDDIIESVDAFHEKYIDEMVRTDEWTVFQNHWQNLSGYIFFWSDMDEAAAAQHGMADAYEKVVHLIDNRLHGDGS